jgi:acetyl-CoA carboxylase carboxyl transferase subunit beta
MGSVVGEKFAIAADLAVAHGVPFVSVASSGGARMQENILALMQMAKTVMAVDAVRDARLPYISICTHPTTGGVIASFAALGDIILAEPGALMSFAGPRVVQQTTGETLPKDFGLAESQLRLGHVDAVVPRAELQPTLARLLALFTPPPEEQAGEEETAPVKDAGAFGWLRRVLGRSSG